MKKLTLIQRLTVFLYVLGCLCILVIFAFIKTKLEHRSTTPTTVKTVALSPEQFSVNYLSIKKHLLAGHCKHIFDYITDAYFPVPAELLGSQTIVEGKLFKGPYSNQIELEREMIESGYRHGSITELLAYKIANPDSVKCVITSMGSFYNAYGEDTVYPIISGDSIYVSTLDFSKYNPRTRFLGIKK